MLDLHVAYLGFAGHGAFSSQVGAIFLAYKPQSKYKMADSDWYIQYEYVCRISLDEHHHTNECEGVGSSQGDERKREGANE